MQGMKGIKKDLLSPGGSVSAYHVYVHYTAEVWRRTMNTGLPEYFSSPELDPNLMKIRQTYRLPEADLDTSMDTA